MSDETNSRSQYGVWLGLALVPLFYTLSVGPASLVVERTGKGRDAARAVYTPLIWMCEVSPAIAHALDAYERFWIAR